MVNFGLIEATPSWSSEAHQQCSAAFRLYDIKLWMLVTFAEQTEHQAIKPKSLKPQVY
jgi:hypothetical protein